MSGVRIGLAGLAAVLALGAAAADPRPAIYVRFDEARHVLSAMDLGERIARGDAALHVIDVRPAGEFAEMHIPSAVSVPEAPGASAALDALALPPEAAIVVYGDDEAQARLAWSRLTARGHRSVFIVREGLYEWISRVLDPRLASGASDAERAAFDRAAALSRFFGGAPRANVEAAEVPTGQWNRGTSGAASAKARRQAVVTVRRRGC